MIAVFFSNALNQNNDPQVVGSAFFGFTALCSTSELAVNTNTSGDTFGTEQKHSDALLYHTGSTRQTNQQTSCPGAL